MRNSAGIRQAVVAIGGLGSLALLVLVVASFDPAAATAQLDRSNPGIVRALALQAEPDAETIYFEQCAPCHGRTGEGGIGPALTTSLLTADERELVIRQGRGAMQAFEATLSAEDIEAIVTLSGRLAANTIFELQCAPCHGATGEGAIGPALVPARLSYEDSRLIIAEGRGGMPAHAPTLTEDQIDAVTAFAQDLARIQFGSEMYARQCSSCHGPTGEGAAGPALVGSDISPREITAVTSDGAGTMPGFAASLAESEFQALILFVDRLVAGVALPGPPVVDAPQLYTDLCAACHGAEGEGGAGPPLAALVLSDGELSTIIAEGQGGMPGFGSELEGGVLDELVAYVQASFGEAELAASGEELYGQLCAVCHGAEGEGGAGPPLAALVLSDEELSIVIAEGQGSMPGFATQLGTDGVPTLAEFLVASFGGEDSPTTTTLAASPLSGVDMYADHCERCHAADGSGDLGPDLRDTNLTLNEVISRIYGGHTGGMPAFEGALSGVEVQEVARFVTNLRTDSDGEGSGGTTWLWPLIGGMFVLAALSGFVLVRRSRGSRQKVSLRDSEKL